MKWGREYCGMKRSIKKPMGELGFHFVGIFLAVFCLFFAVFSEGNCRISEEVSSGNGGHWTHQETDENTAEQMWIYCKKELGEIAKTINGFNLYSDNNPKRDVASSRKTLVHNPVTDLPPQLKRSLLLSLKSKRSRSCVSDIDGCQECLSKLYGRNIYPRKTIRRRHHHHQRRRSLKEPSSVPTESSHKRLSQKPAIQGELLPKKKPPDHVLLIGIIVSTSVATLALFFLLLICCVGGNDSRIAAMSAQEDEKPVINKCPGGISDCSQMPEAVEGNKDSMNSCNKNNLSPKAACQVPEVGNLPLPPGKTAPPPPAPPPPPAAPKAPPPPPPPIGPRPPDPPKLGNMKRPPGPPPRVGLHNSGRSNSGDEKDQSRSSDSLKTKLKPFFWDKMNASPNQAMVWHGIKEGSFQFDEEMMESLFGYANGQSKGDRKKSTSNLNPQSKFIQIIDPRKAQNLAILLKALNVTTERVCNALKEGNELPVVLISTLIKMAPTQEEELKLRLYNGDLELLGPAERFLKVVVEIPFVFKRFEALLFMSALQEESSSLKDAFATLEVACAKLKNSRLFLKLLEAVLKTGNRMNVGTHRGGAQAIKLDSLLKLSDVKGTDGKTTLLSFVVQEIIRSEGIKAARARRPSGSLSTANTDDLQEEPIERSPEYYRKLGLEVVSRLSDELEDVKKAAVVDGDNITSTVLKLGTMFKKTKDVIDNELRSEATEFCNALHGFMEHAEAEIVWMLEEEKRIMTLVKSTGDYFHGNSGKDNEGLRLFAIVRDFLKLLDRVCIDIKKTAEMNSKKKDETPGGKTKPSGKENDGRSSQNVREKLFPAIKDRQMDYSSSDDEDTSP